jgi:hypothetical protein
MLSIILHFNFVHCFSTNIYYGSGFIDSDWGIIRFQRCKVSLRVCTRVFVLTPAGGSSVAWFIHCVLCYFWRMKRGSSCIDWVHYSRVSTSEWTQNSVSIRDFKNKFRKMYYKQINLIVIISYESTNYQDSHYTILQIPDPTFKSKFF